MIISPSFKFVLFRKNMTSLLKKFHCNSRFSPQNSHLHLSKSVRHFLQLLLRGKKRFKKKEEEAYFAMNSLSEESKTPLSLAACVEKRLAPVQMNVLLNA